MALFYGKNKITVHDLSVGVPQSQNTDEGSTYGNYEDLEEEVKRLNKIIISKDEEIAEIHEKLKCQELEVGLLHQQIKELQWQKDNIQNNHKLETAKINETISNNKDEIVQLRNHNKTLVNEVQWL